MLNPEDLGVFRSRRAAATLFAALLVIYNTNGREIGSADTQPTKFTAREIAVQHTLRLDRVIAERPGLAERPSFARDREGHWRSAYPIEPALIAGLLAFAVHATGLVDMDAPLAPNLIAVATASVLTSAAVTLVFLSLLRIVSIRTAFITSIGLGLGTNYWPTLSRTLWQHETVAFGLALALWAGVRPLRRVRLLELWIGCAGLAIAATARWQLAPLVAIVLAWLVTRSNKRQALWPIAMIVAAVLVTLGANLYWFGHITGAASQLEAVHRSVHAVRGSLSRTPWTGALGLLISPSRGVLVFSPIVLVALAGMASRRPEHRELGLWWLAAAALVQFAAYSCYTVWWGGHTYGPRYLVDVFVPLCPAGALGAVTLGSTNAGRLIGSFLLAWSMLVAGMGAFVYPNGRWNVDPEDIDRHHARLWEIRDSEIPRTFTSPWSPQNFELLDRGAIRR